RIRSCLVMKCKRGLHLIHSTKYLVCTEIRLGLYQLLNRMRSIALTKTTHWNVSKFLRIQSMFNLEFFLDSKGVVLCAFLLPQLVQTCMTSFKRFRRSRKVFICEGIREDLTHRIGRVADGVH